MVGPVAVGWGRRWGDVLSLILPLTRSERDWLWVAGMWAAVGPAAAKAREKHGEPRLFENFEALAKSA